MRLIFILDAGVSFAKPDVVAKLWARKFLYTFLDNATKKNVPKSAKCLEECTLHFLVILFPTSSPLVLLRQLSGA